MNVRGRSYRGRGRGFASPHPQRTGLAPPAPVASQDEAQSSAQPQRDRRRNQRSSQWRTNQNDTVIEQFATSNLDRLKGSLFSEFDSLSDALRTIHVDPQQQTIRLSFSVRGIGLTLFETISRVQYQCPEVDIPVHSWYRVSLLQLAAKYDKSRLSADIGFVDPMVGEVFTILDGATRELVEVNPQNFTPVSGIINCCGHFSINDVKYIPSIISAATPLNFTITGLRDLVNFLANPESPLVDRLRYVALNSIPGAVFEDEANPVLSNSDAVIPLDYDLRMMRDDFMRVKACLARVGRKLPKLVGTVNYPGKGTPGILMSTKITGNSPKIRSLGEFDEMPPTILTGDATEWSCNERLSQEQAVCGAIALCGEYEDYNPAEYIIPWQSNRNSRNAKFKYTFSRQNVISGMIG